MASKSDVKTIQFSKDSIELIDSEASLNFELVGNPNEIMAANYGDKKNINTHYDQIISELAFSEFIHGHENGMKYFKEERDRKNINPHKGDDGSDVVQGIDVKSRRILINHDFFDYFLIISERKNLVYKPDHIFVQVTHQYDDSFIYQRDINTSITAWITGWEYFYKFRRFVNGIPNSNLTQPSGLYLDPSELRPISTLPSFEEFWEGNQRLFRVVQPNKKPIFFKNGSIPIPTRS